MALSLLWLLLGITLCLMELFLPTAFMEATLGFSAIAVALLSPMLPHFGLQVLVWLLLSIMTTLLLRRFVPHRQHRLLADAQEAETLTEILPGQVGRVLYEGSSWQGKCSDEAMTIAPKQKVYVIGREGTTLIVMPQNLLPPG